MSFKNYLFLNIIFVVGLGYAIPFEGGGRILFDIEPMFRASDEIAIGLRYEGAVMAKEVDGQAFDASAVASYTLNGQYYFSNEKFRPYVGLGLGIFQMGNVSADVSGSGSVEAEIGSKFGFYPRVGLDFGHFNLNLDFNIVGASEVNDVTFNNSYIGLRIGGFFGGGKK